MPKYKTSDGKSIEKSVIDRRISKAKLAYKEKFIDDFLYFFCERSIRSDLSLDCSHIISVKYAQETGRSELSWDLNNIELLCRAEHLKFEMLANKTREEWYHARKQGMTFSEFLLFNNLDIKSQGGNNLFNQ